MNPAAEAFENRWIRRLIFLYIILWLVEGVFRKWITPGLSAPLLIVRDPVLVLLLILAIGKGKLPMNAFVLSLIVQGVLTGLISLAIIGAKPVVVLYGLRANFVHLLMIFVMAEVLTEQDVHRVGYGFLLAAAPMALLVFYQFFSPPGAWINTGAGGGEGGQIESAGGHIRPAGTFSFTNGMISFAGLVAAYCMQHLLERKAFPRWLWLIAMPSLMVMVVLSGSRAGVGLFLLVLLTVFVVCMFRSEYMPVFYRLIGITALVIVVIFSAQVFQEGLSVLGERFGSKTDIQTGFLARYFGEFLVPFDAATRAEPLGVGLGMGTNAAAGLLQGERTFLLAESELARVILESGPFFGFAYLILRWCMAVYLGWKAYEQLRDTGRPLAMFLFSAVVSDVLAGQAGQPTGLGFIVIGAGLCLASSRHRDQAPDESPPADDSALPTGAHKRPGRSSYAARLNPSHG